MSKFDVVVIGGGPAGLIAAGTAASLGKKVALIEKNDRLGKKLLITGKGRCNITNACEIEDFFSNIPVNSSFLYGAFYTFTNDMLIEFLNKYGVKTKVERGNRVFPESDKSSDVLKALKDYCYKNNVSIINARVTDVLYENNRTTGVEIQGGEHIISHNVIIATGGVSYPVTGSTGDGYNFAKKSGHKIINPKPSLVPIETNQEWVKMLQGLSLKNIEVKLKNKNNKVVYSDFGEMLFTHFGVSGPIILSLSSHLKTNEFDNYEISIDLKPALTIEQLDKRIIRDFEKYSRKNFGNSLTDLLPKKMIPVIIELSKIDETRQVNSITREERLFLVKLLKELTVTIKKFRPIDEAIITSGGVCVLDINPSTMESKKIKGLFFAGEVIDVDGYTGGFNLQIAFSTGYLAGLCKTK